MYVSPLLMCIVFSSVNCFVVSLLLVCFFIRQVLLALNMLTFRGR
jgi:hypothetical protein